MMTETIIALSKKYYDQMVYIRHTIHQNPELGFEEHKTAGLIAKILKEHNIELRENVAQTGVVGLIRGKNPGKTVLLRADMDALAIQEEVDVDYKSLVPNKMHACGHDGHVAGLLGTAMILNEMKDQLRGNVKLVFQPAEETEGGALPMIEAGILKNPEVDAAFACHLWGAFSEGEVHLRKGYLMAAPDTFKFTMRGVGGHGGMPHMAIDPVVLSAQAIMMIQTIVSRAVDPLESAVISIGSIHGGDAHNAIPEAVEVTGTVRSFSDNIRADIPLKMERILKGIAESYGAAYSFEFEKKFPALINDAKATDIFGEAFMKIIGKASVNLECSPSMGGEDFAFISKSVPSAYAFIGIAKDKKVVHHNSKFQWDDNNMKLLSQGMAQVAIDFLSN